MSVSPKLNSDDVHVERPGKAVAAINAWLAPQQRLIGVYQVTLFAGIVLFFAVLSGILGIVATLALHWGTEAAGGKPGFASYGLLSLAMLGITLSATRFLVASVVGLLTAEHTQPAAHGIALDPGSGGPLFGLVARIAKDVKAPLPHELRVSPWAECHVSEDRRFSFLPQRHLTLVIGMPQLCLLTTAELTVFLAHELVHFRCGDTRIALFIFRFVKTLRVVSRQGWLRAIDPCCWFCLAYRALYLRVAVPLQRQLELRADALSAATYGGQLAARTLLKEWLLAQHFESVLERFASRSNALHPGESIYRNFAQSWREFSPAGHDYLLKRLDEEEIPSVFDSHPTMGERVQMMRLFSDADYEDATPALQLLPDPEPLQWELQRILLEQLAGSRSAEVEQ